MESLSLMDIESKFQYKTHKITKQFLDSIW